MEPESTPRSPGGMSAGGCLLRLIWMGIGNVALAFGAIHLAATDGSTEAHVLFGPTVVALFAARAIDVRVFQGMTTDGRPATTHHLVVYGVGLVFVSALLWTAAFFARGWPS